MSLRQRIRSVRNLSLLVLAGVMAAGCAIREPQAITDLNQAREAIATAKQASAAERFPDDFAALEKRFLQARGTFYACQDDEASRLARTLIADANSLATRRAEMPQAAPPPPPPNQAPRAAFTAPAEANVNTLVSFRADESSDPDPGDKLTYTWDFGDGTTSEFTFPVATHRYANIGNYTVRLTVDDGRGGTDTTSRGIQVVSLQAIQSDVLFDFDRATLKPAAEQVLGEVVKQLQDNPNYQVTLVGHTDWIGTEQYNMGLSKRRAEAVQAYLISRGIAKERITTRWQGESQPVAPNNTAEGRAQNRRTDITVRPPNAQ